LKTFGQQAPIVYVVRDGKRTVVKGSGLLAAARTLGWKTVAAVESGLSGPAVTAFAIADNRTSDLSEFDAELLAAQLQELEEAEYDIASTGFSDAELQELLAGLAGEAEEGLTAADAIPETPAKPTTRPGDLWLLGVHRLLCGDTRKGSDVERLTGGLTVHMIFTDPPYGQNNNNDGDLIANREKALGRGKAGTPRPIEGDSPGEAEVLFASVVREAARLLPGGCCCCCCGGGGPDPMFARWSLALDAALEFKQMIIWDKGSMGMGWHYRRSYETVLVAQKPGAACRWFDQSKAIENVIRPGDFGIRKIIPSKSDHPTEKPPALAAHFMRLHSRKKENVLDLFAGYGSTIIAAEQLGRHCMAMEISPAYCDVIVRRWEEFTGKKASRVVSKATASRRQVQGKAGQGRNHASDL
jgi:DNA modification methylase